MEIHIGCVVEGHGDRESVPIVIRRVVQTLDPTIAIRIPPPIRTPKSKLLRPDELERAVELAARRIGSHGAILIVLDSDTDCPARLGPQLFQRATQVHSDLPLAVVLAKHEFEARGHPELLRAL